jgi:cysteine-rich repeat protein
MPRFASPALIRPIALASLLAAAPACRVFDESLYQRAEGNPDALVTQGGAVTLADRCSASAPALLSSSVEYTFDTSSLRNDYSDLAACVGHPLRGNDGFFVVQMQAGEKWHLHVSSTDPAVDPALYVLPTCDERACQPGWGLDDCGAGQPEHMSLVPTTSGSYLVGISGREAGGGSLALTLIRPVCGNGGLPEHSETCDDGNTVSGDGCDALCRKELPAQNAVEVEPNDDPLAANVIMVDAGPASARVSASLDRRCDYDMFAVKVPDGGALNAKLLSGAGLPCALGAPTTKLQLLAPDGRRELGLGTPAADEGCPSLEARGLAAGTYYLRVSTSELSRINYQLKVDWP